MSTSIDDKIRSEMSHLFSELGRIVSENDTVGLGPLLKVAESDEIPVPCPCPYKKPIMRDDDRCRHCSKQLRRPEPVERDKGKDKAPPEDRDERGDENGEGTEGGPDTNED